MRTQASVWGECIPLNCPLAGRHRQSLSLIARRGVPLREFGVWLHGTPLSSRVRHRSLWWRRCGSLCGVMLTTENTLPLT